MLENFVIPLRVYMKKTLISFCLFTFQYYIEGGFADENRTQECWNDKGYCFAFVCIYIYKCSKFFMA